MLRPTLVLLCWTLISCASAPAPQQRQQRQQRSGLRGTVVVPAAARHPTGRLVVWWEAANPPKGNGFARLLALIPRFRVLRVGGGPAAVPFSLDAAPGAGAVRVHALLETRGKFWNSVLGARTGDWRGVSPITRAGAAPVRLHLVPGKKPGAPPKEYCQGPRFVLLTVDAPHVAGTLGNSTRRRLCAHLPRSYRTRPDGRYPVVYLFSGLGSTDRAYMRGNGRLTTVADSLTDEVILVAVDTSTVSGSTYFSNSPIAGRWADFISAAVAHVDGRLRTIAAPRGRGTLGQSTGGFNALALALSRPDLFSAAAASAPDGLDFDVWLTEATPSGRRLKRRWLDWLRIEAALFEADRRQAGQFLSYAVAWSPAGDRVAWPADLETGAIKPAVWRRWLARTPPGLLRDPARAARARAVLNGRILLAVGKHDEFDLYRPTLAFSSALRQRHGIDHTTIIGDGAHGRGQPRRLATGLRFVAARLAESPPATPQAH